jgi:CelD/BcsL family acetyltransferase involved in cellulose biosynthesis
MIMASQGLGHEYIDLGKGDEDYKLRLKTGD